jgi:uncharacterized protein yaaO
LFSRFSDLSSLRLYKKSDFAMKNFSPDKRVLDNCKIYSMLHKYSKGRHLSFHTPGHKAGAWDITELSYSDNLSCPKGVIKEAEKDISEILGSAASFILTDGSTAGVLSMLKASGARRIAVAENAHKSVYNGCKLLGMEIVSLDIPTAEKIPLQPTRAETSEKVKGADALLITSPDYYGNLADLPFLRALCDETGALLLIDGAHGGHLHFDREIYAGTYADLWVDGVHKSLPALTQGAVVSAKTPALAEALAEAADIFRTTSPSYPIMASVEYAVKYPRNTALENAVLGFVRAYPDKIRFGGDWTKLCAVFGDRAFVVQKYLEKRGIYAEFCDGNVVMFYLSPATKSADFKRLKKELRACFSFFGDFPSENTVEETDFSSAPNEEKVSLTMQANKETIFPIASDEEKISLAIQANKETGFSNVPTTEKVSLAIQFNEKPTLSSPPTAEKSPFQKDAEASETEWIPLEKSEGLTCAKPCGLFPPCIPLLFAGDTIDKKTIGLLSEADNVFGLSGGKISVYKTYKNN